MSARRKGARATGPYQQRSGWLVLEYDNAGKIDARLIFDSERKGRAHVEAFNAAIEQEDYTTSTAIDAYAEHLVKKGNKPGSVYQTRWALQAFFTEPLLLSSLTDRRCEKLFAEMSERPMKTGKPMSVDTRRNALSQVRTFLDWCRKKPRHWLRENPCADLRDEYGERRPRGKSLGKAGNELHLKQARDWYDMALYRAHNGDEGAIAALCALVLGMRASEIVALSVAAVDAVVQSCDVVRVVRGKTKKARRSLEVPEALRACLMKLCDGKDSSGYVFAADGKPHWRDWIRKNVRRICKLAGVPEVTAHSMRGLLATIATERGMAPHLVAATLGHEDVRTTMTAYAAPGAAEVGARVRGQALLEKRPATASDELN